MTVGIAAMLLVLVVLVALAVASFFQHTLTTLMLVAIPAWLVLQAFMGASYAVFVIALLAVFAAVIHTIGDTIRLLRTAKRTNRRAPPALAERPASTRRSDRPHIAA